jgi:hypothetical protein
MVVVAQALKGLQPVVITADNVVYIGGGAVAAESVFDPFATMAAPTQHSGTQAWPVSGQSSFPVGAVPGWPAFRTVPQGGRVPR